MSFVYVECGPERKLIARWHPLNNYKFITIDFWLNYNTHWAGNFPDESVYHNTNVNFLSLPKKCRFKQHIYVPGIKIYIFLLSLYNMISNNKT